MNNSIKVWWIPAIIGVLFICFGIVIINNPFATFAAIAIFIGSILIVSGIAEIYLFVRVRNENKDWSWYMSSGVVDVLLGIILIANPKIILIIFTLLISLLLFYRAMHIIRRAIALKNTNNKNWMYVLGVGILVMALTILLIVKPEIIGAAISLWLAVVFIVFGVYRLYLALKLKQSSEQIQ